jgi:small-conductance mechanosensitive channel
MVDTPVDIVEIKLALVRIETLLNERSAAMAQNAHNIGEAFNKIRAMETDISATTLETHKFTERLTFLEDRLKALEQSNISLSHTVQGLKDTYIKMSIVFSIATAVITAGVVKFFVG